MREQVMPREKVRVKFLRWGGGTHFRVGRKHN